MGEARVGEDGNRCQEQTSSNTRDGLIFDAFHL